jgi:5-amino-6-(5-phosphoribosylamino)uracil reductase
MKTTLVLAMTADGKISDVQKLPPTFGSTKDRSHLEEQMAIADAILVGSGTLADGGEAVLVAQPELIQARTARGQAPQPIQIIASRSGKIDRHLPFFRQPFSRWLITTQAGAIEWADLSKFDRVLVCETNEGEIDWQVVSNRLTELGIHTICFLGGAELAASLFAANFIDELWLTICPFIYGGAAAPSPVAGAGFTPELAPRLELLSVDRIDRELFVHYRVTKT